MTFEEWKDLPTIESVAMAKGEGWEIEHGTSRTGPWVAWNSEFWNVHYCYRGRPRQPKMVGIDLLRAVFQAGAASRDAEIAELVAALEHFVLYVPDLATVPGIAAALAKVRKP